MEFKLQVSAFEPTGPGTQVAVTVRACENDDTICTGPRVPKATGVTTEGGDESEVIKISVRHGFDGFFWVDDGPGGYVDTIRYVDASVTALAQASPYVLLSLSTQDAEDGDIVANGNMAIRSVDCDGVGAAGISFVLIPVAPPEQEPIWVPWVEVSRRKGDVTKAESAGSPPQDVGGYGGFDNVPPGVYDLHLIRRDKWECVRSRRVLVRPHTRTELLPTNDSLVGSIYPGLCP